MGSCTSPITRDLSGAFSPDASSPFVALVLRVKKWMGRQAPGICPDRWPTSVCVSDSEHVPLEATLRYSRWNHDVLKCTWTRSFFDFMRKSDALSAS